MKVLIAGGGIGGYTAALSLHDAGIDVHVVEQARELGRLVIFEDRADRIVAQSEPRAEASRFDSRAMR